MPYLIAAIALLCLLGLHLWWQRRYRELRDQSERAASELEARQQALFNSMPEGVLILDGDERILMANVSLQRLLKLTNNVHGQTVAEALRIEPLSDLVRRLRDEPSVIGCESSCPARRSVGFRSTPRG